MHLEYKLHPYFSSILFNLQFTIPSDRRGAGLAMILNTVAITYISVNFILS